MAHPPPAPSPHVLVTGSTGHLGSWLVKRLLERGYRVRAAVMDPEDEEDLEPISGLPLSLAQNLEIVKANLFVDGDFDAPVHGCDGIFHLACPTNFNVADPQRDMIDPAVGGTLNVLKSCIKSPSVKRVVYASSATAVWWTGEEMAEQVFDESRWTDVEFCIKSNLPGWPYIVGKTLAERAATEFAQQHDLDLVILNPTIVIGPFLISRIPSSVKECLAYLTGEPTGLPFLKFIPCIHTDDVARAFIFLYETPAAKGRHICSGVDGPIREIAHLITSCHPGIKIRTDLHAHVVAHHYDSSKLQSHGFQYKYTLEDMFDDAIKCCKEKALL